MIKMQREVVGAYRLMMTETVARLPALSQRGAEALAREGVRNVVRSLPLNHCHGPEDRMTGP